MPNYNPLTDAYIEKAADFAKPILAHIRKLMHDADPDIEEVIKWGHVHFDHKGPIAHMAAYTKHCNFGFWKAGMLDDPEGILKAEDEKSPLNGLFTIADLPSDEVLLWYIRNAVNINISGLKPLKVKTKAAKPALAVPDDLAELLSANTVAAEYFDAFTTSQRNEYLEWITEAKTDSTRQKRLTTAVEWIAEGKIRNWKYQ